MKNVYGLPPAELDKIRERDQCCVYCGTAMTDFGSNTPRFNWRTVEHFRNSPPWDESDNVGFCCSRCNSSKGNRPMREWFAMPYCVSRGINELTVAEPVKAYLRRR